MDSQEATERMAISMLSQFSENEKKAVFRCIRALEKVMRSYGKLAVFALSILAIKIQAGQRPGSIDLKAEGETPEPTQDKGEKMARINLAGGGFDDAEIEAIIEQCRKDEKPFHTLHGLKKELPPDGPDDSRGNDDQALPPSE